MGSQRVSHDRDSHTPGSILRYLLSPNAHSKLPFDRWESWDREKLSILPQVRQLISGSYSFWPPCVLFHLSPSWLREIRTEEQNLIKNLPPESHLLAVFHQLPVTPTPEHITWVDFENFLQSCTKQTGVVCNPGAETEPPLPGTPDKRLDKPLTLQNTWLITFAPFYSITHANLARHSWLLGFSHMDLDPSPTP